MRRLVGPIAGLAVGLVVVLVLTLAGSQPAKVAAPSTDQQSGLAAAQTTQSSSGGPNEGIRVHGNWTIEVRNADGTLASRNDFENALVGGPSLAMVLGRLASVGYWEIQLFAPAAVPVGPCGALPGGNPPPKPCTLNEVFGPGTLTVSAPSSGPDGGKLVLSGTGTATTDSSIGIVATRMRTCDPSQPPTTPNCNLPIGLPTITSTTLASPIPVTAGQQLQVTVRISFQ